MKDDPNVVEDNWLQDVDWNKVRGSPRNMVMCWKTATACRCDF